MVLTINSSLSFLSFSIIAFLLISNLKMNNEIVVIFRFLNIKPMKILLNDYNSNFFKYSGTLS